MVFETKSIELTTCELHFLSQMRYKGCVKMRFMGNKAKLLDEIDILLKDKKIDKKERKQFEEPKMEIIEIEKEDIITNSGDWEDPDNKDME